MKSTRFLILFLCMLLGATASLGAQGRYNITWHRVLMDGSRTGCKSPGADDVAESLGTVQKNRYNAPNGKVYRRGVTPAVAAELIACQPDMKSVKEVLGMSPRRLEVRKPECELSDFFADSMLEAARQHFPLVRVDVSIGNFGGIRADLPEGKVLVDNLVSMFPFKNRLAYVKITGKRLYEILEQMVTKTGIQVMGGMRIVVTDGVLTSVAVGGKPLDLNAEYGLTTVDFLLHGGDNLYLSKDAIEMEVIDVDVIDFIMPAVKKMAAEGKPITYNTDGRVQIINTKAK